MQDLRQNLKRFHDSRPRAVKVLIPIGQVDRAVPHRSQFVPFRTPGEPVHFLPSTGEIEAARH